MAEGDQIARAFGGHDAGEAGDFEDVALGKAAILNAGESCGLHYDTAAGAGNKGSHWLVPHLDHAAGTRVVEVGEVGHTDGLRFERRSTIMSRIKIMNSSKSTRRAKIRTKWLNRCRVGRCGVRACRG